MDRRPPGYPFPTTSSLPETPYSGSLRTEASPPAQVAPAPDAPDPNSYRVERPVRLSYTGETAQLLNHPASPQHPVAPAAAPLPPMLHYPKTTMSYVSSRDTPLAPDGRAASPGISGDSAEGEGSGDEYEFVDEEDLPLPPAPKLPPKAAAKPGPKPGPKASKAYASASLSEPKPVKEARPPPTQRVFKPKVKKIKLKPGEMIEEMGPPELDANGVPIPGSERKISHARKTAPGHIKRPPNAFILFRSHCCAPNVIDSTTGTPGTPSTQQLADLGITDHRHISRIVSHLWKSLPAHEKKYWDTKAQEKKEEHQRMYPDYRYKPVYRNKDEVRKRRKGADLDVEEEKRGCEQVALALLGPAEQAAAKERWTIDTVAAAVHNGDQPPPGKKVKRPRKKAKRVESPPIDEYEYAREMVAMEDMRAGSATNDAAQVLYQVSQRSTQGRPRDASGNEYGMYNAEQGPSKRIRTAPNAYAQSAAASPRRPPSLHMDYSEPIPYNPSFQYYPSASDNNKSLKSHYEQYSPARQLSPEALGSMRGYSFGAAPKPHPLSFRIPSPPVIESDVRGSRAETPLRSASAQTASFPTPNLAGRDHPVFAGMQRRGTFSRTSDGGNLMLVSPRGEGRTFSLAKWDVKGEDGAQVEQQRLAQENGQSTPIGGQFDEPRLTAYSFDPDYLSAAQTALLSGGPDKGFARQASGEPFVDNRQAQSIDALLAASDPKQAQYVMHYADASPEMDQYAQAGMSSESAAAMDILIRSQLRVSYQHDGTENRSTVFLTVPQASEPMLVDRILKKGFAIIYDHSDNA